MPRASPLNVEKLGDTLVGRLTRDGLMSSAQLRKLLRISQPSFSRIAHRERDRLLVTGKGRATRYAARRVIGGLSRDIPIYEVQPTGETRTLGTLTPIWPDDGFWFTPHLAGLEALGGHSSGLPWFLTDMVPSGFVGTLLADHVAVTGGVPRALNSWTSSDALRYLAQRAHNAPGNLVVGDGAFRSFLSDRPRPVATDGCERVYRKRVKELPDSLALGAPIGGAQPKFLADRTDVGVSAIVKFSPRSSSESATRAADLLVCEHLALETLAGFEGAPRVARSELMERKGQTFLEVERFDRAPTVNGRHGVLSLRAALAARAAGKTTARLDASPVALETLGWAGAASELERAGLISRESAEAMCWLDCFGSLIAKRDRDIDGLGLYHEGLQITGLCPAYGLRPSAYEPRQGAMVEVRFAPPLPRASQTPQWLPARDAAEKFWRRAAGERRLSKDFRQIAKHNAAAVRALRDVARRLPK